MNTSPRDIWPRPPHLFPMFPSQVPYAQTHPPASPYAYPSHSHATQGTSYGAWHTHDLVPPSHTAKCPTAPFHHTTTATTTNSLRTAASAAASQPPSPPQLQLQHPLASCPSALSARQAAAYVRNSGDQRRTACLMNGGTRQPVSPGVPVTPAAPVSPRVIDLLPAALECVML
jgi:hypothetical protein